MGAKGGNDRVGENGRYSRGREGIIEAGKTVDVRDEEMPVDVREGGEGGLHS